MLRVILIEDDMGHARLVQELIREGEGVEIVLEHALRLADGLRLCRESPAHLLLLDLSLPDASGPGTFTTAIAQLPNLPIVILSTTDDPDLAERLKQLGAREYLVKGRFDGRHLVRTIRRILAG